MSDTVTKRGRARIEAPSLGSFSAADAANAALNKPAKPSRVSTGLREFDKEKFVEKIMKAVAIDAASKHPKLVVYLKWPRTANPHKDELFAEFESAGYRLSLEEQSGPLPYTALCVDYRPAE